MSVFSEWRTPNSNPPHVFNGVLLVFTMLALCIAWVAMCIVIYRYIKKLCNLRRERNQQEVVNAALRALAQSRAQSAHISQAISSSQCHYYTTQYNNPPTYAEALNLPLPPQPPKDDDRISTPSTMSSSSDRPAAPPAYEVSTSRF